MPCEDFVRNETWMRLVLIAQDLHAHEPSSRVWHAAAVIAHSGRQTIVRIQCSWPWRTDIVIACQCLRIALPG